MLERTGDGAPRGMTVHDRTRLIGRLRHLLQITGPVLERKGGDAPGVRRRALESALLGRRGESCHPCHENQRCPPSRWFVELPGSRRWGPPFQGYLSSSPGDPRTVRWDRRGWTAGSGSSGWALLDLTAPPAGPVCQCSPVWLRRCQGTRRAARSRAGLALRRRKSIHVGGCPGEPGRWVSCPGRACIERERRQAGVVPGSRFAHRPSRRRRRERALPHRSIRFREAYVRVPFIAKLP